MRQVLIVAAMAACGGKGTSGAIAIEDLQTTYIAATCTYAVDCDQMPDAPTCMAAYQTDTYSQDTIVADVKAGIIKYDGEAAGKWIDALTTQSCVFAGWHTPDLAASIYAGTIAAGGACVIDEECAGTGSTCAYTASCDPTSGCCAGTCMPAPSKVPLGASCAVDADCVDGLFCADDTMRCSTIATGEGTPCHGFVDCADPMVCNFDPTGTTASTCFTPAASNATCDPTLSYPCGDVRDYCDLKTNLCTRKAPVNAACDSATPPTTGVECVDYAECDASSCVAHPAAMQACMPGGVTCLGELQCDTTNTCTLPPAGVSCR